MHRLSLHLAEDPNLGPCVELLIDGESFYAKYCKGTVGMWPQGLASALLPALGKRRRTQLGRCGCGDTGCDYLIAEIAATGEEIIWTDFVARGGGANLPKELSFERTGYVRALDALPSAAYEDASAQPVFCPPGPPFHFFMIAGPESTMNGVFARFRTDDIKQARELARIVAAEQSIAEADYLVLQAGTKHLEAVAVEGITRPPSWLEGQWMEPKDRGL